MDSLPNAYVTWQEHTVKKVYLEEFILETFILVLVVNGIKSQEKNLIKVIQILIKVIIAQIIMMLVLMNMVLNVEHH